MMPGLISAAASADEPSGKPIKYLKGIETERGFEEVPEEEIIKGYEHTKGHHVLIKPEELDGPTHFAAQAGGVFLASRFN